MNIKRRARNLYRKYRTSCPFTIARMLGITIMFLDLPDNVKGYQDRILRRKIIVINDNLPDEEKRFICAHELAHFRLHKGHSHYFITRHTGFPLGRYENQADEFATHLLTAGEELNADEPLEWYLNRCGVPKEMERYLY
ncbi:ImmA/IrrE family metallo-endopeptidase [Paenibacillus bouchesdurhonensis]|uniref:ImmA/IrrE family metallo-endopeptidase n=1 Tax=Paenibacillus bouchesdurhonensis TaxID=1870990 RepID=UPI001F2649FB|nr:ImmA/IrrE family metallo-endopeptidase [Paenibacillus bouchesdurhonensis]